MRDSEAEIERERERASERESEREREQTNVAVHANTSVMHVCADRALAIRYMCVLCRCVVYVCRS